MPRALGSGKGIVEKRVTVKDPKTGATKTKTYIYARVRVTDPQTGKRGSKWLAAKNRTDATEKRQAWLAAACLRAQQPAAAPRERATFGELATVYAAASLIPAEYRDGRKIRGRRGLCSLHTTLARLCDHFGAQADPGTPHTWTGGAAVAQITYDDLDALRLRLLDTPVRVLRVRREPRPNQRKLERVEYFDERPRKIATVNRALGMLRNMLNFGIRRGWITENPFRCGDRTLISSADETRRNRFLSFEEEARLFEQFTGKRAHLKAIVMCALDTGMRQGEIFKLRVRDIERAPVLRIHIRQENTKTLQARTAPISARLLAEIDRLLEVKLSRPDDLLFGVTTVKRSFATACAAAGIEGLRFHDLRRTAATRLHHGVPELGIHGLPTAELARILGHGDIKTTFVYLGANEATTGRAADLLDTINQQAERLHGEQPATPYEC